MITMISNSFNDMMATYQTRVNEQLECALPAMSTQPCRLHQAMHYAIFNGGKRLRPMLVYATGAALGLPLQTLDPLACALELIHCYSLVHDDLPAMDNDDWRRGQPSCHKAFDEATALLAGNGLLTLAFEICANPLVGTTAEQRLASISILTRAIGSDGLIGGQALEFDADILVNLPHYLAMIQRKKTGALIHAAVMLPTLFVAAEQDSAATAAQKAALDSFGHALGLAFQIRDDLLDFSENTPDAEQESSNFARLFGREAALAKVDELHQQARQMLNQFGDEMVFLRELLDYLTSRTM